MFSTMLAQVNATAQTNNYEFDTKGNIKNNLKNYVEYLNTSDFTKDRIKYNNFLQRKEYDRQEFTDFI